MSSLLESFYTTSRLGAVRLSDGGGPFGFDITVACQIDQLIVAADIDGIVETGTYLGDTTEYLGRQYPQLRILSIEIDPEHAKIATARCRWLPNVEIVIGDSAVLLSKLAERFDRPLAYLDAHWGEPWPLQSELQSLQAGYVAIDDFQLHHSRFGYDEYCGQSLNAQLVTNAIPGVSLYVGNPFAEYPYPCLQVGRRTGTAFASLNGDDTVFEHPYFLAVREGEGIAS